MDRNSLSLLIGQGMSVEQIAGRFGRHPSTVSYWMRKHGIEAPNRTRHAAKGGIDRERLEVLVAAGMSIAEIAAEVGRAKTTVRHWLARFGLRTASSQARRSSAVIRGSRAAGHRTVALDCARHGEAEFVLEGRGYYRCKRCRSERVSQHRRELKAVLVHEAGGRCRLCGYDRSHRALAFHHLEPEKKVLPVSWNGVTVSIERLRAEARKCVLLCANCHAEVEDGLVAVPLEFVGSSERPVHHNPG
jgi:transposase